METPTLGSRWRWLETDPDSRANRWPDRQLRETMRFPPATVVGIEPSLTTKYGAFRGSRTPAPGPTSFLRRTHTEIGSPSVRCPCASASSRYSACRTAIRHGSAAVRDAITLGDKQVVKVLRSEGPLSIQGDDGATASLRLAIKGDAADLMDVSLRCARGRVPRWSRPWAQRATMSDKASLASDCN